MFFTQIISSRGVITPINKPTPNPTPTPLWVTLPSLEFPLPPSPHPEPLIPIFFNPLGNSCFLGPFLFIQTSLCKNWAFSVTPN